jgi:nucleotide-binding universal stress UspA family protein
MKRIERILVGTDFSEIADQAVDSAIDLAVQLGASVTVLHAYEPPIYNFPDGAVVAPSDMVQRVTNEATERLAEAVERRKGRGVRMESILRMGAPWEELNTVAAEQGIDLVVVGTHGRRGFSRALLGSVAERLLRTAVRPVLIVRSEAQAS